MRRREKNAYLRKVTIGGHEANFVIGTCVTMRKHEDGGWWLLRSCRWYWDEFIRAYVLAKLMMREREREMQII